MTATVLICTYNRAALLAQTLDSLANMRDVPGTWDVLVVDNNSSDDTARIVSDRAASFPVPLRYLHEPRQGKSHALNTGLAHTTADIVAFTDDDVRVSEAWLRAAMHVMGERPDVAYVGGPVHPIWGARPPAWFPPTNGNLWGTVAILDYGPSPFEYEAARRVPIGANMAVRRAIVERAGGFAPELGRTGASLLGQEQAEFFYRTRALGARGEYVPAMVVSHHVPAARLTRRYFRRWWWWKGISRARLHARHPESETGVDLARAPRMLGVPRFAFGEILSRTVAALRAWRRDDRPAAAEHEMLAIYAMGYALESCRAFLTSRGPAAHVDTQRVTKKLT